MCVCVVWMCVKIDFTQKKYELMVTDIHIIICVYSLPFEYMHALVIWDRFREKGPSAYYKKCYKNMFELL